MTLAKLIIKHETTKPLVLDGTIEALFNPTQISSSKDAGWKHANPAKPTGERLGRLEYTSGGPETFNLDLFFDTYEGDPNKTPPIPGVPSIPVSVLPRTDNVAALAAANRELHRPPACEILWGKRSLFAGVLKSFQRDLLMFLEDGTPVRAVMRCAFIDHALKADASTELHSSDVAKTYRVRPGDTLSWIAYSLYGDQAEWRRIAEANNIENPRTLTPGTVLAIPTIT